MKKLFIVAAFLLATFACSPAHAQGYRSCGPTGNAQPITVGGGLTIVQCWSIAGTSQGVSYINTGNNGGSYNLTAGDGLIILGYQCIPYASGSTTPCQWVGTNTYLFPCYATSQATCATTNLISDGSCAQIYEAPLQTGYNTHNAYPNYIWYCKSLPSTSGGVSLTTNGVALQCSSTSATFTGASTCDYISLFMIEVTGACTTSNTGCFDQSGNANSATTGTSLSVTSTGNTAFTDEVGFALGGTVNDEVLSAANGASIASSGDGSNGAIGNTVFYKYIASAGSSVTMGQSWTGADYGGIIMVTILTTDSAPAKVSNQFPRVARWLDSIAPNLAEILFGWVTW